MYSSDGEVCGVFWGVEYFVEVDLQEEASVVRRDMFVKVFCAWVGDVCVDIMAGINVINLHAA